NPNPQSTVITTNNTNFLMLDLFLFPLTPHPKTPHSLHNTILKNKKIHNRFPL
ncbi:unnamed protein product, partial [Sphagnum compactum]